MTTDPRVKNRLLIVDDEPTNIHILSNILSSDYEIRAANNGERPGLAICGGHCGGACSETLIFKHAHWAVPENGSGFEDDVGESTGGLGANIDTHPAWCEVDASLANLSPG